MPRIINPYMFAAPAGDGSVITSQSLGTERNDFSGKVGFRFTVGASNITITDLGRWIISGNSGTHTVYLMDDNNFPTTLGSVSINASGATPAAYKYNTLSVPAICLSGVTYNIVSQETNGADKWYSNDTSVVSTAAISVLSGSGLDDASPNTWFYAGAANTSYVPPNFIYS